MASDLTQFLDSSAVEQQILSEVANEYKLTGKSRRLLFAIRKAENGGPGREMGVLRPEAMRYAGDFEKSLRLQAQWAAGTIDKRFTGNLEDFAKRWAPVGAANDPTGLNKNFLKNIRFFLEQDNIPTKQDVATQRFERWYAPVSRAMGISPDPYDRRHRYDYRAFFNAMVKGKARMGIDKESGELHFPSKFKLEGHPTLVKRGIDTRTGRRVG